MSKEKTPAQQAFDAVEERQKATRQYQMAKKFGSEDVQISAITKLKAALRTEQGFATESGRIEIKRQIDALNDEQRGLVVKQKASQNREQVNEQDKPQTRQRADAVTKPKGIIPEVPPARGLRKG